MVDTEIVDRIEGKHMNDQRFWKAIMIVLIAIVIMFTGMMQCGCGVLGTTQTQKPAAEFEQHKKEIDDSVRELQTSLEVVRKEQDNSRREFKDITGTLQQSFQEFKSEVNSTINQFTEITNRMETTISKVEQVTSQSQVNDPKLIIGLAIVAAVFLVIILVVVLGFLVLRSLKKGSLGAFG